jgi:hypothetical protein
MAMLPPKNWRYHLDTASDDGKGLAALVRIGHGLRRQGTRWVGAASAEQDKPAARQGRPSASAAAPHRQHRSPVNSGARQLSASSRFL